MAHKTDPMDDSTTHDETNHSAAGSKKKDEPVEAEEHAEEADDDSGAEADDNVDQGDEVKRWIIFNCFFWSITKNSAFFLNDRTKTVIFRLRN